MIIYDSNCFLFCGDEYIPVHSSKQYMYMTEVRQVTIEDICTWINIIINEQAWSLCKGFLEGLLTQMGGALLI